MPRTRLNPTLSINSHRNKHRKGHKITNNRHRHICNRALPQSSKRNRASRIQEHIRSTKAKPIAIINCPINTCSPCKLSGESQCRIPIAPTPTIAAHNVIQSRVPERCSARGRPRIIWNTQAPRRSTGAETTTKMSRHNTQNQHLSQSQSKTQSAEESQHYSLSLIPNDRLTDEVKQHRSLLRQRHHRSTQPTYPSHLRSGTTNPPHEPLPPTGEPACDKQPDMSEA